MYSLKHTLALNDSTKDWSNLESRQKQRENAVANVWPPSPKAPARELSPKRGHKSSKKHSSKRARSSPPESSSVESSDEEDRRRRHKDKKPRSKREKERDRDRKRRRSRTRSRDRGRRQDEYERESNEERRTKHRSKRSETHSESRSDRERRARSESRELRNPNHSQDDDSALPSRPRSLQPLVKLQMGIVTDYDDDDEFGPMPLIKMGTSNKRNDERAYGGALLRGEGSAMAAFLKEGGTEARIPRRGEIGLTSDEIAKFEDVGYVMSVRKRSAES
ncbi:hypothetical protein AX17_004036 [Amanita inopinata Kibby_2008]|nr:hypothetical protein AX17_004036 [Amanita inopinata Kibby_2008]